MPYQSICISSGHSTKCQGAIGYINEVEEATKVVDRVYEELKARGVKVEKFHDTTSTTQDQNLNKIVNWHNSKTRQLDISCHFNANKTTSSPVGTEVWYVSQEKLSAQLSAAIANSGLKDRGAKYSSSLFFLNGTAEPAVLLEIAFVDSATDVEIYKANFDTICADLADVLGGVETGVEPPPEAMFTATGTCSHFGGPDDLGVSPSEGLAFHYALTEANQHLFLPIQPHNTTGLARRLNAKAVNYVACRWDYNVCSKTMLAGPDVAMVTATKTGLSAKAFPADWGPHEEQTGRAADLSPCLMDALGIETDDEVTVVYPYHE